MKKIQPVSWKEVRLLVITGAVTGLLAVLLQKLGNPANMGFCIACFLRDTAGALGFDQAEPLQYIRPEIIGLILGSFVLSLVRGDFRPRGGASPLLRFFMAMFVMIGSLAFLGCPLRMALRLAAGDLNALVALVGFVGGIGVGALFVKRGFSLGQAVEQPRANGYVMPAVSLTLLTFLLVQPSFIRFSESGPGAAHAPILIALAAGLIVGSLAQQSRLCMSGGIRDVFLIRNFNLVLGYGSVFVFALLANLFTGGFRLGFVGQPIAHTEFLWNALGMALVGYGSVLLGGCPMRQLILTGEGSSDAGVTVLGFVVGAAVAHNFKLAASADGVPQNGRIAVLIGFVFLTVVALLNTEKAGGRQGS